MANDYTITVPIEIDTKGSRERLKKEFNSFRQEIEGEFYKIRITADSKDLDKIKESLKDLKAEDVSKINIAIDRASFDKHLQNLKSSAEKNATEIGKTFKKTIQDDFNSLSIESLIEKQFGKGTRYSGARAGEVAKGLYEKLSVPLPDNADYMSIVQMAEAYEQLGSALKEIKDKSPREYGKLGFTEKDVESGMKTFYTEIGKKMSDENVREEFINQIQTSFTTLSQNIQTLMQSIVEDSKTMFGGMGAGASGASEEISKEVQEIIDEITGLENKIEEARQKLSDYKSKKEKFPGYVKNINGNKVGVDELIKQQEQEIANFQANIQSLQQKKDALMSGKGGGNGSSGGGGTSGSGVGSNKKGEDGKGVSVDAEVDGDEFIKKLQEQITGKPVDVEVTPKTENFRDDIKEVLQDPFDVEIKPTNVKKSDGQQEKSVEQLYKESKEPLGRKAGNIEQLKEQYHILRNLNKSIESWHTDGNALNAPFKGTLEELQRYKSELLELNPQLQSVADNTERISGIKFEQMFGSSFPSFEKLEESYERFQAIQRKLSDAGPNADTEKIKQDLEDARKAFVEMYEAYNKASGGLMDIDIPGKKNITDIRDAYKSLRQEVEGTNSEIQNTGNNVGIVTNNAINNIRDLLNYWNNKPSSNERGAYINSKNGYSSVSVVGSDGRRISDKDLQKSLDNAKTNNEVVDTLIHTHPESNFAALSASDIDVAISHLKDGITNVIAVAGDEVAKLNVKALVEDGIDLAELEKNRKGFTNQLISEEAAMIPYSEIISNLGTDLTSKITESINEVLSDSNIDINNAEISDAVQNLSKQIYDQILDLGKNGVKVLDGTVVTETMGQIISDFAQKLKSEISVNDIAENIDDKLLYSNNDFDVQQRGENISQDVNLSQFFSQKGFILALQKLTGLQDVSKYFNVLTQKEYLESTGLSNNHDRADVLINTNVDNIRSDIESVLKDPFLISVKPNIDGTQKTVEDVVNDVSDSVSQDDSKRQIKNLNQQVRDTLKKYSGEISAEDFSALEEKIKSISDRIVELGGNSETALNNFARFKESINIVTPQTQNNESFQREGQVVEDTTSRETTALSQLQNKISDVTDAVDRKTDAFRREAETVDGVVNSEINVLDAILGEVDMITNHVDTLNEKLNEFGSGDGFKSFTDDIKESADALNSFATILNKSSEERQKAKKDAEDASKKKETDMFGEEAEIFTMGSEGWDRFIEKAKEANIELTNIDTIYRQLRKDVDGNVLESFVVTDRQGNKKTIGANTEGVITEGDKTTGVGVMKGISQYEKLVEKLSKAGNFVALQDLENQLSSVGEKLNEFVKYGLMTQEELDNLKAAFERTKAVRMDELVNQAWNENDARIKAEEQQLERTVKMYEGLSLKQANSKSGILKPTDQQNLENARKIIDDLNQKRANGVKLTEAQAKALDMVAKVDAEVSRIETERAQAAADRDKKTNDRKTSSDANKAEADRLKDFNKAIDDYIDAQKRIQSGQTGTQAQDELQSKNALETINSYIQHTNDLKQKGIALTEKQTQALEREKNKQQEIDAYVTDQARNQPEKELNTINKSIGSRLSRMETNTTGRNDSYTEQVKALREQYNNLQEQIKNIDWTGDAESQVEELKNRFSSLEEQMNNVSGSREFRIANQNKIASIDTSMSEWKDRNSNASSFFPEIDELQKRLQSVGSMSDLDNIVQGFERIKKSAADAGKVGKSFGDTLMGSFRNLARYLLSFASFYRIIGVLRGAVTTVKELDSALMEVRKVSSETVENLKEWQNITFDQADTVGGSAKQIQESTATWLRLGKSFTEAQEAAQASVKLLNVSEFTNIDDATTALVSMRQAFSDLTYEDFIDKLNGVGDNFSSSTDQLAQGMKNVSSVLKVAGNDIDQSLALLTAANDITQDMSKASMGVRTVALRISGTQEAKQELEDLGEDVSDFVVQTQSKVDAQVRKYTQTAKNPNGISVLDKNGRLRSTYDVLRDISEVYDEIVKKDNEFGTNTSNALLELLAGKTRSNILASILQNPEVLQDAYEQSKNSQGVGQRELDIYLDSVEAKLAKLQNRLQELASLTIDSDWLKALIDLGTEAIKIINTLAKSLGGLNMAIGTVAGIFLQKKGFGIGSILSQLGGIKPEQIGFDVPEIIDPMDGSNFEFFEQTADGIQLYDDALLNSQVTMGEWVDEAAGVATAGSEIGDSLVAAGSKAAIFGKSVLSALGTALAIIAALKLLEKGIEVLYNQIHADEIAIEKGKEAKQAIDDLSSAYQENKKYISDNSNEYEKLSKGIGENNKNISLSEDEYSKLLEMNNKLAEIFPQLVTGFDEQGNAILKLGDGATSASEQLALLLEQERQIANFKIGDNLGDVINGAIIRIGQLKDDIQQAQDDEDVYSSVEEITSQSSKNMQEALKKVGVVFDKKGGISGFKYLYDPNDRGQEETARQFAEAFKYAVEATGQEINLNELIEVNGEIDESGNVLDGFKYYLGNKTLELTDDLVEEFSQALAGKLDDIDASGKAKEALMIQSADEKEIRATWNSAADSIAKSLSVYNGYDELGEDVTQAISNAITNIDLSIFETDKVFKEALDKYKNGDKTAIRAYFRELFLDPFTDMEPDVKTAFDNISKLYEDESMTFADRIVKIQSLFDKLEPKQQEALRDVMGIMGWDSGHYNLKEDQKDEYDRLAEMSGFSKTDLNSILTEGNFEIAYDLVVNKNNSFKTIDDFLAAIQKAQDEAKKIESDTFSSLFKDESDEGLQKTTDAFQETIENVKKYREEIAAGDFKDATDMTQTFNENMKAGENYTDYLNRVQLKALQDFTDNYKRIISGLSDPDEQAEAQRFLTDLLSGIDWDGFDVQNIKQRVFGQLYEIFGSDIGPEFRNMLEKSLVGDGDWEMFSTLLSSGMSPQEALDEVIGPDGLSARVQLQLDKQSLQDEIDKLTSERSTNEARKSMLEAQGFSIDTDYYLEDNEISNQLIRHYEEQIKIAEEEIANSDDKDFINTQQEKINELQRNIFSERATKASNRSAIRELMLKPFEDARKEIQSQMGTLESTKGLGEANGQTDFSMLNQRMIDLLNSDNEQIDAEIEQLRHQQSELSIRAKWTNKELSDMDGYKELVDKEKDLLSQRAKNNQQRIELQKEIDNAPLINLQNIGTALSRDTADAEKAISQAEEYGGEVSRAMYQSAIDAAQAEGNNLEKQRAEIAGRIAKIEEEYELAGKAPEELLQNSNYQDLISQLDDVDSSAEDIRQKIIGWADAINNFDANKVAKQLEAINSSISADEAEIQAKRARGQEVTSDDYNGIIMNRQAAIRLAQADVDRAAMDVQNAELSGASSSRMAELDKAYAEARAALFQAEADLYSSMEEQNQEAMNNMDAYINNQQAIISNTKAHIALLEAQGKTGSGIDYQTMIDTQGRIISTYKDEVKTARNDWNSKKGTDLEDEAWTTYLEAQTKQYEAEQALIDLQVEQAESKVKDQENAIRDAKLEQTNLQNVINEQVAQSGEADASLYNALANSYTAEAEQQRALAKYWSDLAKSEKNPELAAQFLEKSNTAFSDALSAEESAREQRTMPIQNELKELQNQMQKTQAEATKMEEAITKAETNHQKVGANMYKNLIKNGKDQIKNLVMQRVEQRKLLKMVDEGSEKWYEYQSNIDSLSSEISAMQNNIVGWSETMTSLVSTNAEALSSALSSAFSEMDSGTGMTIDTMNELKKQFSDLKGFNMDNVFYETADGVKMNKSAVEELVDQEYMLQQAILEEALAQENLSATDRVRYEQQLSMLQAIYDQQKANFTGYAEWQTAQSTDNAGKRYEDIQGALKSVQEMYSKGLTGTDDFRSFVSMIDQWGLDTVDAYDRNIEMVKRYVTEDSSGLVNFFNDLVSKGLATGDATEGWVLDVQNMEEAAKTMNMSTELFDILISRSDDYGFINTWVDSVLDGQLQMKDGTQELIEAEQRLIQLQEQGADQKVIEDAAKHRDELATQLKDISTATEQVQKMEGKITASQVRQQESFLDNLLSLRGQEGVDQDVLRKEFENITATLGVELNWEDVNEGDIQSEFESKFPGYLQVKAEPVIDLTNRPHVDAQTLRDMDYENVKDGTATVYSHAYSNEDETATVVVTPILPDGDILKPEALEHYANQILEGGADEYGIGLKIFEGEDSKEQAQAYSDMLHETQALFDMDNPVLMETLDMMQNYKGDDIDKIMFGDGHLADDVGDVEKQIDKLLDTMGLGQEKGEALKEVLKQMAYGVEPVNGEPTYETGLASSSFEAMRQRGLDTSSLEGSSIEVQAEVIPHITQETTQEELDKMTLEANVNAKINAVQETGVSTTQLSNMTDEQKISLGFDESELETLNAKLAEMTTLTVKIDESQIAQLTGAEDVKIGADTSEVTTAIEEAEAEVEGSEANMKIGGDAQIALATARATTTIINNMRPSIKVTAETGNLVNQIRNSLNNHVFTVRTRAAGATSAGGKKEADATGTILSPVKASGTAYNMLNLRKISGAFASGGKVDLPEDEEALVNEVGTESIVRDGQWYLLPGGPHVESLKKGDIVFSASQTEDLLKRGRAIGHGKAYAEGSGVPLSSIPMMSAYGNPPAGGSRGKLDQTNVNLKPSKTNNNDQKKATINNTRAVNNNTSAIDNFKKWLDGWVDWIDNRLDALNNTIDRFTNRSENLIGYGKKNKDIQSAMNRIASLYTYQNADVTYTTKANGTKIAKGYKNIKNAGGTLLYDTTRGAARYQRQADDVIKHAIDAGIFGKVNNRKNRAAAEKKAMDLVDKIQTGRIDIQRYNENIREVISSYEDWFGKSQELINNLEEIKQQYKDLEQTKLDNITTQFETLADYASAVSAVSNSFVELATARGTVVNDNNIKNAYKTQMQQQGYTTGYLQKEEKAYRDELKNATRVFGIGSNEWVEALSKYQNIKQALNESETAYRNLNQQLKELDIHKVELVIERLEKYGNTLASRVSLAGKRENEYRPGSIITEKDYAVQLENNGKILQKYWENYNNRLNEIAMLNPDVDSDKYQELYNNIMGDVEAMQKLLETNEDLKDSIVELRWKNFEDFQKTLDNAISDYEHLQSLMKETQFFDADYGIRLTDRGMADIALIAKMMDTERQKIADYRKALQKLEDDYKNKNITLTKYNETSREYIEIIQQSASAVAGYKDALVDLYKTQITNENNLLQENIKLRKDALQQKKSYYDYDKTLKSKNKDLAQLQSQVNALRGTTSQAGQAELARLQAQLKEAQEDMEETQRDHEYDVMQQGFDKLSEDANKILEDTIKHIDAIPEKLEETANNMLAKLNGKYDEAYTAVQQVINETGTKIGEYAEQQLQVNTDSKEALDGIKTASESINTLLTSTILQDGVVISSEFTNKIEQKIFQKQDEIIEEMRKNNEIAKARNAEWAQYVADVKAGKDNSNKTITGNNNTPQEAKPEPAKTQKQPTNTNNNKSGNTGKGGGNSFASVAATATKTSTKQAIKDILAKGKYHKGKATAAERKAHNALWEHIVDTYHRVPTYAMYKEIAKLLGVKMSKTPTEKEKTNLYNAMKKKGYSKGSKYIDDDELNWLHNKEIVIRKSDGAILQPFNAGDMVFTSKQSENLWKMSQVDPDVIKKMVSDVDMNKFIMPGISDKLAGRTENNNNNQTIHFDSLITINGNADQQTVADLQQIAQGLVNNREFKSNVIKFVTKDMTREAAKAGYRGR